MNTTAAAQAASTQSPTASSALSTARQAREPVSGESSRSPVLPGSHALEVLEALPSWGQLVTIVLHGGCVFEFKGPFPRGAVARGYYNLAGPVPGFHGHLRLDAIDHIGFQDRLHAGRPACALTFNGPAGEHLFKVFLGREANGEIIAAQRDRYEALRAEAVTLLTGNGVGPES